MMSLFLLLVPALLCHVVVSGQTLQSPVPVEGEIEPSNTTSIDDLSFAGVRNENEDNSSVPENLSTDAVRSVTTTSDTFSSDVDNEETPERVDGIGKHRVPTLKSLIARVQQRVTTYPILYQGLKKGREGRDSLNDEEGMRGASGSRTWFEKNPKVTITVDAQGYPHRSGAKVRSRVTDHQQSNQGGDAVLAIGRSGNSGLFAEQHAPYTSRRTSNNQLPDSNGYSGYSGKNSMNSNDGAGERQRTRDYPAASDISLLFSKLSQIENELLGLKQTVLLQGSVHIRTSQRQEALIVNQIKLALQNSRTSTQILEKLNSCCGCTAPGKESADLAPDAPLSRRASMPDKTGTSFVSNGTESSKASSAIRNVTEVDDTLRESRSDVKETNGRQNQTFVVNATSERATSSGPSTMVRKVVDVPIEAMPSNTTPTTTLSKMAITSPTPISKANATSVVSTAKSHRENGEEVTDDKGNHEKQADEEKRILAKKLHDPGDEDSESDEEDESDEDSSDDDDNEEDENQSKYRRKEPHGADSDDDDEDDDESEKEEKEADDSDKTKMDRHGESDEKQRKLEKERNFEHTTNRSKSQDNEFYQTEKERKSETREAQRPTSLGKVTPLNEHPSQGQEFQPSTNASTEDDGNDERRDDIQDDEKNTGIMATSGNVVTLNGSVSDPADTHVAGLNSTRRIPEHFVNFPEDTTSNVSSGVSTESLHVILEMVSPAVTQTGVPNDGSSIVDNKTTHEPEIFDSSGRATGDRATVAEGQNAPKLNNVSNGTAKLEQDARQNKHARQESRLNASDIVSFVDGEETVSLETSAGEEEKNISETTAIVVELTFPTQNLIELADRGNTQPSQGGKESSVSRFLTKDGKASSGEQMLNNSRVADSAHAHTQNDEPKGKETVDADDDNDRKDRLSTPNERRTADEGSKYTSVSPREQISSRETTTTMTTKVLLGNGGVDVNGVRKDDAAQERDVGEGQNSLSGHERPAIAENDTATLDPDEGGDVNTTAEAAPQRVPADLASPVIPPATVVPPTIAYTSTDLQHLHTRDRTPVARTTSTPTTTVTIATTTTTSLAKPTTGKVSGSRAESGPSSHYDSEEPGE